MTDPQVEAVARAIFETPILRRGGPPQIAWVEGGNSIRQDEARDMARAAIAALDAHRAAQLRGMTIAYELMWQFAEDEDVVHWSDDPKFRREAWERVAVYHVSQLADAYRAGAEAMREAAVTHIMEWETAAQKAMARVRPGPDSAACCTQMAVASNIAAAIRALPLPKEMSGAE